MTELGTDIAAIIDGGDCSIGIESTVLDLSTDTPAILRSGKITEEQLKPILGSLGHPLDQPIRESDQSKSPIKSPGLLERHYAPDHPLRMNASKAEPQEAFLGFGPNAPEAALNLSLAGDIDEAAANLFSMIRSLDQGNFQGIAVMPVPEEGLGCAINDRLRRAAHD